jgi:hypothetical protein
MRRIILSSVACLAVQYFSTLSHKRHDFRGKKVLNIKCVFWFSLQLLSETFLILRRIQRDIIINVHRSSCKVPLLLWDFNETWKFKADFRKILKYQISLKSVHWEPSCSMQTDRLDEANSRFSQFWKRAKHTNCGTRDGLKHILLQLYMFLSLWLYTVAGKMKILHRDSGYQ